MSNELQSKSILVIDNGLFLSFARKMAERGGYGTVFYANNWKRGRPSFNEISVGKGYDGITVVKDYWDVVDEVDVIAFPDVLDGDLQLYLRKHDYAVWGSGKAQELEIYRLYSKQIMEAVGLAVNPYVFLKGVSALREYLQEHDDRFVKISFLRGLWESRHHDKYWMTKTQIDRLEYLLGPLAEETEFLVESPIKTKLEIGFDGIFVTDKAGRGDFLKIGVNGVEIKDSGYVGVCQEYEDMADELREVNDALRPVLERYAYCNFFSTENRVKKVPYLIDPCCRQGSPSGEAQLAMWTNMPNIVHDGAHGIVTQPEHAAAYVAQAMIYNKSDEAEWLAVEIPEKLRDNVMLYFGMRKGLEDYVVPQHNPFDEAGSVIATGDTAESAIESCKEMAEQIGGDIVVHTEALDKAFEEFELMENKGISVEPISN